MKFAGLEVNEKSKTQLNGGAILDAFMLCYCSRTVSRPPSGRTADVPQRNHIVEFHSPTASGEMYSSSMVIR